MVAVFSCERIVRAVYVLLRDRFLFPAATGARNSPDVGLFRIYVASYVRVVADAGRGGRSGIFSIC